MTNDLKTRFAMVAGIASAAADDRKSAMDALQELAVLCDEIEGLVLGGDVTHSSNFEPNEELARMQEAVRASDALTVQRFRQAFAERHGRPVPLAVYDEDILRWFSEALGMPGRHREVDVNDYVIGKMRNWN